MFSDDAIFFAKTRREANRPPACKTRPCFVSRLLTFVVRSTSPSSRRDLQRQRYICKHARSARSCLCAPEREKRERGGKSPQKFMARASNITFFIVPPGEESERGSPKDMASLSEARRSSNSSDRVVITISYYPVPVWTTKTL